LLIGQCIFADKGLVNHGMILCMSIMMWCIYTVHRWLP